MDSLPRVIKAIHKALHSRPRTDVEVLTKPVPASRPRVTRWGTYYGKNYTAFRKEAERLLAGVKGSSNRPLAVITEVVVPKPKSSQRLYPRGDNDNFEKAIWDSISKCPGVWDDDDQIVFNTTTKRFPEKQEAPGYYLTVYELEL